MAKLPSIEDLGQRPSLSVGGGITTIRDSKRVSEDEGRAMMQLGEAISKTGQNIGHVVEQEAERLDTSRAEDATNKLQEKRLDLTYGKENGFTNLNGRDAVEKPIYTDWTKRFDSEADSIEATLGNDRQKEKFRHRRGLLRSAYQGDIMKYAASESDKYQASVYKSTLDTETRNIGANPADEASAGFSFARVGAEAERESRRLGKNTTEELANARSAATDHLWVARLEAWRLKDPTGALAAFQQSQDQISPLVRVKLAEGLYRDAAPVLAAQLNDVGGPPVSATSVAQGVAETAIADGKLLPRGVRNNNPGNIIAGPTKWGGQIEGADPKYASFETPEDGIRALGKNLLAYGAKGIDTVTGIVARWAPATENDTQSYIARVSKELGVNPTEPLNLKDRKVLTQLAQAIITHENGGNPYSPEQVSAGVEAAISGKELPRKGTFSVAGLQNVTPAEALRLQTGNAVIDALPPDQKLNVLQLARTQANQGSSQARHALQTRVEDTAAAYERGMDAPNPPSPTELITVFGQFDGERIASKLAVSRQFGQDVQSVQMLPASQQAALIAARQPVPGEGFADAEKRHEQLVKAVDAVARQREQDPSLAVLRSSPQVQASYRAFVDALGNQDPTSRAAASQAFAASTLAEQQRLEIRNPQVLSKDMVDSISKRFAEPAKDGQGVASIMRGIVDDWGRYWPQVGKQLSKSLPPGAVVIGLGIKPEAEAILGEALKLKPEQLNQGIPETDIKDIKERVRSEFEPLRQTLAWQGGGIETYDNYADSATTLATALVQKGFKIKEAAEKAWESTVGFKYDFQSTWRVPKEILGGTTSIPSIRTGAEAARRDVTSEKPLLGDPVKLLVPTGDQRLAGVRPSDLEKQWRETVRDNGFWVTSPGDGGLSLYVKSGLGAQPVLDESGAPIRRSWDQLSGIGNSVRAAFFSDVSKRKP